MDFIDSLWKDVGELFVNSNGSHDLDHTKRVYNNALKIAENDDVDLDVVKISVILHDIARKCQDDSKGKVCHAEVGAKLAKEILSAYDLKQDVIDKVVHCIETHRFRKDKLPESKEARILFDADKLDSIGAIGIGRAISFSGEIGAKVHDPEVVAEDVKEYSLEDTAYREFLVKLCKVKDMMFTDRGREIAKQRHEFMEDFFDRINKECRGEL